MFQKYPLLFLMCSLLLSAVSANAQQVSLSDRSVVRNPNFTFRKPVESWKERKTRHVVMQKRDYSCGAAALATLVRYYWGHNVSEETVLNVIEKMLTREELEERSTEGLTMTDIREAAVKMGYQATVGEVTLAQLSESKIPVILVLKLNEINHFVVCRDIIGDCVFLADPIRGNTRISLAALKRAWVKNAILVVAPEGATSSQRSQMDVEYRERIEGYLNRQAVRRQLTGVSAIR